MAGRGSDLRNWLCLLACVAVVGCGFPTLLSGSLAPYISYEIIIPRQLDSGAGKAKKDRLSYTITAAGKTHIIRLKQKNNFLVGDLPVFTYSEGRKVKSHPYIPAECFYGGYVEGRPDSLVTLDICFGLRGFLKIRELTYGIEPLGGSPKFQHLLYLTDKTSLNSTFKHRAEAGRKKANARFLNTPLYIELYIVVDNGMFHYAGGNETRVRYIVLDTIHLVYTYYRSLNIDVTLVGLEIWTESNPIEMSGNSNNLSDTFRRWQKAQAKDVERDVTHLFARQRLDAEPGNSYIGRICTPDFSVGVDPYLTRNQVEFSKIVSHMLGHNLGMEHDGPHCFCDEDTGCLMHASYAKFAIFSNCSVASVSELITSRRAGCLRNVPAPANVFRLRGCGNGVVGVGEECDCGDECKRDPCCHPNCTFRARAECAKEECCERCRFAHQGKLCRGKRSACDLPAYCTGKSRWCPADVYVQDGTPCGDGGYCYAKNCSTHNLQCAGIFGKDAKAAPPSCFKTLNQVGGQQGNCGREGDRGGFAKCKGKDILCGRLHCTNVRGEPDLLKYTRALVDGIPCWSVRYRHGSPVADVGAVPGGTVCWRGKICMNRTCVPLSLLKSECDPKEKCHNRGVCNNRNRCHCEMGWAPPRCTLFGAGGSLDSGPPIHTFTEYLFSLALRVAIPLMLVGAAAATFLTSKLWSLLNRCRRRIACAQ